MVKVTPINIFEGEYTAPEKAGPASTVPYMPETSVKSTIPEVEIVETPKKKATKSEEYKPRRVFRALDDSEEEEPEKKVEKKEEKTGNSLSQYFTAPNIFLGILVVGSLLLMGNPGQPQTQPKNSRPKFYDV